jgi:vacuolar-type H+-ATPase subunit I/STV1
VEFEVEELQITLNQLDDDIQCDKDLLDALIQEHGNLQQMERDQLKQKEELTAALATITDQLRAFRADSEAYVEQIASERL